MWIFKGTGRNRETKKEKQKKVYDNMPFYPVFLYTVSGNYTDLHSTELYRGCILKATVC